MERTTNSADARRAADYLSRYCNENGTDVCKGCFAREDSGFCILCESSPNNWELPSIWSAQEHRARKGHDAVCKNYRLAY